MKKINLFAMLAVVLTIFSACQKDDLTGEQPQAVASVQEKPDVYVENGYLAFKDYETLDSIERNLNNSGYESVKSFEDQMGFKSAYSYLYEAKQKVEELPESQAKSYLKTLGQQGYFDSRDTDFVYPFYNETFAVVLNTEGKVKIGDVIYQFKGDDEIVTPDVNSIAFKNCKDTSPIKISMNSRLPRLKDAEVLDYVLTADNHLRTRAELKREHYYFYGPVVVNGQLVTGQIGEGAKVYIRYYSYRQYSWYKSDRPTYFNTKLYTARIGGNSIYGYLNINTSSPTTVRTTTEQAVDYYNIFDTGFLALGLITTTPNVYQVNAEFWSDYVPIHNYVIYP